MPSRDIRHRTKKEIDRKEEKNFIDEGKKVKNNGGSQILCLVGLIVYLIV